MASNKVKILCILFFYFSHVLVAQQKYFIRFTDKNNSNFSLDNPSQFLSERSIERRLHNNIPYNELDLPVNSDYVESISNTGATILYSSKWLNGVMVSATDVQITSIQSMPFVLSSNITSKISAYNFPIQNVQSVVNLCNNSSALMQTSINYGGSFNQLQMIGADEMHAQGYTGKGKLIAVLDDGFKNIDTLSTFDSLFMNNRIVAISDFVDNDLNVFNNGGHGTHVLSILSGYTSGKLVGVAWQADYLLLRSENDLSESISEEYNWVRAAEFADSAGADIISSSLGYNTFDNSAMNHSYFDLDGNKTIIVRGADIAASKGILVVNAAGNEGNGSWKHILTPADGDSVLTVGGVDSYGNYLSFSSTGPTADGRIKPDLVTMGNQVVNVTIDGNYTNGAGTSYATPAIAGLAAGLWQAFPQLSNMEIINCLKRSASQYARPDNYYGYGIPSFGRAKDILEFAKHRTMVVLPNPIESEVLFLNVPDEELSGQARLVFYDNLGHKISEESIGSMVISNQLITNVSNWSRGIYFINIITNKTQYKIKFLKI